MNIIKLVVNLDDIIEYCDAQISHLLARRETVALAQLRGVKEFCKDFSFVLGDDSDNSSCSHD